MLFRIPACAWFTVHLLALLAPAAQFPAPDRWEKDIAAFEAADKAAAPPRNAILFVGSSSIRLWDLPRSFPKLPAINRGFGGSFVSDSVYFAPRIVLPYEPPIIVLYAGDNDLAAGKSPETVRDDYLAFVKLVHQRLPATRIVYLPIKPSIQRWNLIDKIREANKLIAAAAANDRRLAFVDIEPAMLGEDGKPRPELLVADGLHLSAEGYALWAALLSPHLRLPGTEVRMEPNSWALERVKSGALEVAHACWWGFDPTDATAALQAAIDSGASSVVLDDMGAPWVVEPIRLASNQEVVLARDVIVRAKRGAFKGKGDCLFTAARRRNVALTGHDNARLEMWRQDYAQAPYEKAEWRHALSIRSCAGVRVKGLTLAQSGGDGIYLGVAEKGVTNSDVVVQDVVCESNYRQGISVISAENLLLERCVLKDTAGTPPMSGIDFEPNDPSEKLERCVMRDCVAEGNRGAAFDFYLNNLRAASAPVSIRLERCRARGNLEGVRVAACNDDPVAGTIECVDCLFESPERAGIAVNGKPAGGCALRFERCTVSGAAAKDATAPIVLSASARDRANVGGLALVDCVVKDEKERLPMAWRNPGAGVRLVDITGTLAVECAGKRTVFALDARQLDAWFPPPALPVPEPR